MNQSSQYDDVDAEVLSNEELAQRFWVRYALRQQGLEQFEQQDDAGAGSMRFDNVAEVMSLPRARTNIEAVLGLLAAFCIGLPIPLISTVALLNAPFLNPVDGQLLACPTFLVTAYLCVTVVRLAGRAIEGETARRSFSLIPELNLRPRGSRRDEFYIPLSLAMAIRLPNWWTVVRPFIAIWWAGHFVIAAVAGHMVAKELNGINNAGLVAIPFTIALTMAFLLAANMYLMLSIAVGVRHPRVWLAVWRYRFVVDLVLTVAMIVAT